MIQVGQKVMVTSVDAADIKHGVNVGDIVVVKSTHKRLRRVYFDIDNGRDEWWLDFDCVSEMKTPAERTLEIVEDIQEKQEVSQVDKKVLHLITDEDTQMSLTVNLKIGSTLQVLSVAQAKQLKNMLGALT